MKGDYSLLDIIRHELLKCGIKTHLANEKDGWSLNCGDCNVIVDEVPHKFFICDHDYAAFYITVSLMNAVCEIERFVNLTKG